MHGDFRLLACTEFGCHPSTALSPVRSLRQLTCCTVTDPTRTSALVTGAKGFVGPHLSAHLADCGDEVTAIDRDDGPDLLDAQGWIDFVAQVRPDVIYHLAGWSDVGSSWKSPAMTQRVNAEGTLNVLEAARLSGCSRVIVISSADLYGSVDPKDLPLTEDAPVKPRSPYGASKQSAEAIAKQYVRGWGLEVIIARPFNHIGTGQSVQFAVSAFADRVARCEMSGGGTVTHGDLTARRDLSDVRDVVRAYRLLATSGTPGEVYNICSGRTISMQEILETLIGLSKAQISSQIDEDLLRPVELPVLLGSHAKLTTHTGWTPTIDLAESLGNVLADARQRLSSTPNTNSDTAAPSEETSPKATSQKDAK